MVTNVIWEFFSANLGVNSTRGHRADCKDVRRCARRCVCAENYEQQVTICTWAGQFSLYGLRVILIDLELREIWWARELFAQLTRWKKPVLHISTTCKKEIDMMVFGFSHWRKTPRRASRSLSGSVNMSRDFITRVMFKHHTLEARKKIKNMGVLGASVGRSTCRTTTKHVLWLWSTRENQNTWTFCFCFLFSLGSTTSV